MRNRVKCKKCETIIEPFNAKDPISCQCIKGDFVKIDDEGNEILIAWNEEKLSKKELLDHLDNMIKNFENIPVYARSNPINHYDFLSLMILISMILKYED